MSKRQAKISLILALWLTLGIGASYLFLVIAQSNAANLGIPFGSENEGENLAQLLQLPPETANHSSSDTGPVSGPSRIYIPQLDIDSNVQHVGITQGGNMGVPIGKNKWIDVAWYKLGPKPGEKGNAVISGHVDNALGMNAVFANLERLNIGDEIIVKDASGKDIKFRITAKETYGYKNAPLDEIFGPTDKRRLNLITCGGSWIQSQKTYSHRLVIYSEAVE